VSGTTAVANGVTRDFSSIAHKSTIKNSEKCKR
jgi:hypothetical protein